MKINGTSSSNVFNKVLFNLLMEQYTRHIPYKPSRLLWCITRILSLLYLYLSDWNTLHKSKQPGNIWPVVLRVFIRHLERSAINRIPLMVQLSPIMVSVDEFLSKLNRPLAG